MLEKNDGIKKERTPKNLCIEDALTLGYRAFHRLPKGNEREF